MISFGGTYQRKLLIELPLSLFHREKRQLSHRGIQADEKRERLFRWLIVNTRVPSKVKGKLTKKWLVRYTPSWNLCCALLPRASEANLRNMLTIYVLPMIESWEVCSRLFTHSLSKCSSFNPGSSHLLIRGFLKSTSLIGACMDGTGWVRACSMMNQIRAIRVGETRLPSASLKPVVKDDDESLRRFIQEIPETSIRKAYSCLYGQSFTKAHWMEALAYFEELQRVHSLKIHHVMIILQNLRVHSQYGRIINVCQDFLSSIGSVNHPHIVVASQWAHEILAHATAREMDGHLTALRDCFSWEECVHIYEHSRQNHHRSLLRCMDAFFRQKKRRIMLSHPRLFSWFYHATEESSYTVSSFTSSFIIAECDRKRYLDLGYMFMTRHIEEGKELHETRGDEEGSLFHMIQTNQQHVIGERLALCESLRKLKSRRWHKAITVFNEYSDTVRLDITVFYRLIPYISQRQDELESLLTLIRRALAWKEEDSFEKLSTKKNAYRILIRGFIDDAFSHRNILLLKIIARAFPALFSIDKYFFRILQVSTESSIDERQELICSLWGIRECNDFITTRLETLPEEITLCIGASDWLAALQLYTVPMKVFSMLSPATEWHSSFQAELGQSNSSSLVPGFQPSVGHKIYSNLKNTLIELRESLQCLSAESMELLMRFRQNGAVLKLASLGLVNLGIDTCMECVKELGTLTARHHIVDMSTVLEKIIGSVPSEKVLFVSTRLLTFMQAFRDEHLTSSEFEAFLCIVLNLRARRRKKSLMPSQALDDIIGIEREIIAFLSKQPTALSLSHEKLSQLYQLVCSVCHAFHAVAFIHSMKNIDWSYDTKSVVMLHLIDKTRDILEPTEKDTAILRTHVLVALQGLWNHWIKVENQCASTGIQELSNSQRDARNSIARKLEGYAKSVLTRLFSRSQPQHLADDACKILSLCRRQSAWQLARVAWETYLSSTFHTRNLQKIPVVIKRLFSLAYVSQWKELLHMQSILSDPMAACIILRKCFASKESHNLEFNDSLFTRAGIHRLGVSELVFIFETLTRCEQYETAHKLYFYSRLQNRHVHRAILGRLNEPFFRTGHTEDAVAMRKLLMCYVAFDRTWYGEDWFLPEPLGWISNLCSRYAARCRTRRQSDLLQRTLDEIDFFTHCFTHLLHENTQSPFRIAHHFYQCGILPQRTHVEMLWGHDPCSYTAPDEETARLSSELLTWLRRTYQVPHVVHPNAEKNSSRYTMQSMLDKIRSVDEPISLGKWCTSLRALVEVAPSMFASRIQLGRGLEKNHDRCVFYNTINRVVEVLVKNHRLDFALALLKLAHHDTSYNPFLHTSFVRVFQRYVLLEKSDQKLFANQRHTVDYLLHRLIKHVQMKDVTIPNGPSLQTRQKPNIYIQASYISVYLSYLTSSSVVRQIIPLMQAAECFPLGFVEKSTIDRGLTAISNDASSTLLSGFTYVISTLLKVADVDLVRRLALRDISECRTWEGALYRLQLFWDRRTFDRTYEKAALRAVLMHSYRCNFTTTLRWDVVLEAMAFYKLSSVNLVSEERQSFYHSLLNRK